MLRWLLSTALWLSIATSLFPQDFKLIVTENVPLGQWVAINIKASSKPDAVLLRIRKHTEGQDREIPPENILELKPDLTYAFTFPERGSYTVHATAFFQDTKALVDAEAVFSIGDVPAPTPTPTPMVVGGKLIVVLAESSQDTPERGRLYVELRDSTKPAGRYLVEKGHQLLILDPDMTMAKSWVDYASTKKLQLPALIIQDLKTKDVIYSGSLPETSEAGLEVLKKIGG
jgi:hypothetical protein